MKTGRLHKAQPSSLCPAAANNHITTVSQLSQEASPKDIITIPLLMQSNTPTPASSQNRDAIESASNIVISPKIIGKEVIIIDDVITTGSSLQQFAEELHTYGVSIKAAVFLAQTAKYPTDKELRKHMDIICIG